MGYIQAAHGSGNADGAPQVHFIEVLTAVDKQIERESASEKPKRARERRKEEMEKYFGNAYRGDPGVPHADPDRFVNIWIGSAAFSVLTYFNPYMWQLSNQFKYSSISLSVCLNSI